MWLPSKEPGHRLVRHQKLTPLELTTGLAILENNRGLLWPWHPQARPPEMKDLGMSEALPNSLFKEAKSHSCCEKIKG